jgi:hypothetical protein
VLLNPAVVPVVKQRPLDVENGNNRKSSTSSSSEQLQLRYDYTNLQRVSPLAQLYEEMQHDCTRQRIGLFHHQNKAGLGSNLHVYGNALCLAVQMENVRMRTEQTWVYRDEATCDGRKMTSSESNNSTAFYTTTVSTVEESPMDCYFPQAEPICENDDNSTVTEVFNINDLFSREINTIIAIDPDSCPKILKGPHGPHGKVRAATTEYLFTRVSDIVQEEGERQLNVLFGNTNRTQGSVMVPKNLITVHIRWGDKTYEMDLIPIDRYIEAVHTILRQRRVKRVKKTARTRLQQFFTRNNTNRDQIIDINEDEDDNAHIYLSTEDPLAVEQFMSVKPANWIVYLDQYYVEALPTRVSIGDVFNAHVTAAENLHGRTGLVALGSLLVAMEANDFVLTTGSNWSRLMNEIRKNIINPRCNDCTTMIDLFYDEY